MTAHPMLHKARQAFAQIAYLQPRWFGSFDYDSPQQLDSKVRGIIDERARTIRAWLAAASAESAALDETGHSTTEDIERRLRHAAPEAHVICAREIFNRLQTMSIEHNPGLVAARIRTHLSAAGTTLAALEETGQNTSEEMVGLIDSSLRYAERSQRTGAYYALVGY